MSILKFPVRLLVIIIITSLVGGCAVPTSISSPVQPTAKPTALPPVSTPTAVPPVITPTKIQPSLTPTVVPPTITSTPDFIKATSLEDVKGTWYSPNKKLYLRFYQDGFLHHSHVLEEIDAAPHAKDKIWFEGTQMYMEETEVFGVPSCKDAIGRYEVKMYPEGNILIVKIEDRCSQRAAETALPLTPVR